MKSVLLNVYKNKFSSIGKAAFPIKIDSLVKLNGIKMALVEAARALSWPLGQGFEGENSHYLHRSRRRNVSVLVLSIWPKNPKLFNFLIEKNQEGML